MSTSTIPSQKKLQHLNSITHEGKVVVLATDTDGNISYTVKQDGFEDSYLNTPEADRTGWETWQALEFPDEEKNDESVIAQEKAELTYQNDTNKFILKSFYQTQDKSAVAPVQLISALGHIYVFRQSKSNTLWVDRFILDGMTNKLNRKLEVRFKRSKQKHTPTKNMKKGANGLENVDTLDFRDADGNFFYEPTTELCVVDNLLNGWFSVVLVPTIENDVYRWHIFAYNNSTKKVELTTIRASAEGLFDVKDYTVFEDLNDTLVPRRIPGVIKRTLDISGVVSNGLAATKYDLQQEQETQSGEMQLIRTATRLMLAVPTNQGTIALSFAIAGDGTLAQIDETPESTIIRSKQREVLLPLNILDEIKAFGDITPPPKGMITGLKVGTDEEESEDLVKISTDGKASELKNGDLVKITDTRDYQGLYSITKVEKDTFEIDLPVVDLPVVDLPVVDLPVVDLPDGKLIFDGMILAYEKDGYDLKVTYNNHGLDYGDTVQIAGTEAYKNIYYPVYKINDNQFIIVDYEGKYVEELGGNLTAKNLKLVSQKRRGIVLNGVDDYISLPDDLNYGFHQFTIEAWVWYDSFQEFSNIIEFTVSHSEGVFEQTISFAFGSLQTPDELTLLAYKGGSVKLSSPKVIELGKWIHLAITISDHEMQMYKDGERIQTEGESVTESEHSTFVDSTKNYIGKTDLGENTFSSIRGKISDVRIWSGGRTKQDIRQYMYRQLTGQEVGLVGYWPLDAITEGKVRDLSVNRKHGTVFGDAYVIAATPERKLPLGSWEKQEEESGGLIFDGMITAYEKRANGNLKVTCPNHGLNNGEQVQIIGTEAYNDTYPVQKIDDTNFVIQRKWAAGEALNVKRVAAKRRGIVFDGNNDYIAIPDNIVKASSANKDFEATCSAWIYKSAPGSGKQLIVGGKSSSIMELFINQSGKVAFRVGIGSSSKEIEDSNPLPPDQWVHYAGVVDYNNKTQGTMLMLCKNGVELVKRVFPQNVTVLPVLEEKQKLIARDKGERDNFGNSVAISGDTAIVGADLEDADEISNAGSAYIFQRDNKGTWQEVEKLIAKNRGNGDKFGNSVAISGDTAIVGADLADSDDGIRNAGSAYIFQRDNKGTWQEVEELQASEKHNDDYFGCSVAISGDTAIVGAYGEDTGGLSAGSAYIFQYQAGRWQEVKQILSSDKEADGKFGYSVAISGDTAIVGASGEYYGSGSAYIFQRDNKGTWQEVEKLIASDKFGNDSFGNSVAISGDRAIVGACNKDDSYIDNVGSAYIFQRDNKGTWQEVKQLQASDRQGGEKFGYSVAISGDTAIVGAYLEGTGSINQGSAYIFQRDNKGTWQEVKKLQASDKETNDKFGNSVAISGDTAIVGADQEDAGGLQDAGSAYIFTFEDKSRIGESFVGKIADVQIWNKAGTAQEIKNNMYLQLTGKEVGLVGYWRLGAISEGKVIDFSVNGNNGTVYGDAYVSAATLNRKLAGGTQAVQYSNPELFAVSERATYEESFEFKVIHPSKPVNLAYLNNADREGKIFTFSYWGKTSRSAEETTPITESVVQNDFQDLGGGWYRASCNVTIPERVSLLRSFEIANIKGNWTTLEIRKHRISLLSDSITEAKYTDSVNNLRSLSDSQAALPKKLQELQSEEDRELDYIVQRIEINNKLELLKIPATEIATKKAAKEAEIVACEALIESLTANVNDILQEREKADLTVTLHKKDNYRGRSLKLSLGRHHLNNLWNDEVSSVEVPPGLKVTLYEHGLDWGRTLPLNRNCNSLKPQKFNDITTAVQVQTSLKGYTDKWVIQKELENADGILGEEKKKLALLKGELNDLDLSSQDAVQLGIKREKLTKDINSLQATLNQKNRAVLEVPQATAQTMCEIAKVKGLATQGAILGFVTPASRLNALETCEGNVQLSYFDREGRMRQTKYDAVADGNNAAFEEWIPDAKRVCLKLSNKESIVLLKNAQNEPQPLLLTPDWSIEAWFVYPLPETAEGRLPWNTLIGGGQDDGCHIRVKNGNQLGIYLKEVPTGLTENFWDSGYNLDLLTPGWHHLTAVGRGDATLFYIDGKKVGDTGEIKVIALADAEKALKAIIDKTSKPYKDAEKKVKDIKSAILKVSSNIYSIGNANNDNKGEQFGKLAEVRIWGVALSEEEIAVNSKTLLSGNEPGLLAYYPMNEASGVTVRDHTGNEYNGTLSEAERWWGCTAPIGLFPSLTPIINISALVSNEYSTVTIDPITNRKVAIMRRFLGYPSTNGITLLPDKRVEELELKWIGNAQFAPTLLGYIEGAPPVPSENLTLLDDYNSASSVELTMSEDLAFSWNRGQDSGLGGNIDTFIGVDTEITAGLGVEAKIGGSRAGFKGNFEFNYQFQNQSSIASSSSLSMTDKLELRGTSEETAKFPHLGIRFIPKNVGYALVVSSLADVFITRLARSGKMVGYQVQPVDGIPPDINTITFLINPAYTMNGSLDGLTGSIPTSDRFFKHVPEMRSQYGSLYPASYYRLQEAYDLKQQIEAEDKRRESYFSNFNVRTLDETSLDRNIDSGDAPAPIGVLLEENKPDTTNPEQGNTQAMPTASTEQMQAAQGSASEAVKKNRAATEQRQAEIEKRIKDQEKQVQATSSFASWQKRMEDIQIRAGKRNIVNTYVWDADGGLRTEAQNFANTVEHTIGGSFTMNAGLGFEGEFTAIASVALTSQATVNLTQTMSKTENRSKGFQLNVDLGGLEHKGITDHNDKPIMPGEKVDRYRFMSFYLEGSTQNFHDFFNYVVDPEWLASNDEEARALREAQAGKPNKAWRVLHRVTYVERPALMGFGRDVRKLRAAAAVSENQQLLDKIAHLEKKNQTLEEKLDKILDLLKAQK
jgi:hypothetical protein